MTRAIKVAIALLLAAATAHADNEPWKQGVSPERMETAQRLLESGNALFLERNYTAALAKYQQALEAWDHPSIRFNMVRALIQLDRVVEAYDNLELALKYGAAPLEENVYSEAVSYQKLLAKQIANVVVDCKQPGAQLTLDGQQLLTCPGTQRRRVLPGQHQIVGKLAGHLTRTIEVFVVGGKDEHATLSLEPLAAAATVTHRWQTWIPWAVVGGGVVLLGLGGVAETIAVRDHDRFYDRVARECAPTGCPADFASDLKDQAVVENRIGIGLMSAGAATLIGGGVMLYMNRWRTVYGQDAPRVDAAFVPTATGANVSVRVAF
ncbi:MAG TPA: hypothetical protein VIV40_12370 [Kofleriaceae bacterium]